MTQHERIASASIAASAAAAAGAVVRADGLGKDIDSRAVLDDLRFSIPSGEFVALLGANGAGKSTLLKVLATLIQPSRGSLTMFGQDVTADAVGIRARIGVIGHGAMLYRDLSPVENLVFFARLYRVPRPQERAMELLNGRGLGARAHDPVRTFSRGMMQRVSIARALVHQPQMLLADEPFTGLDAPSAAAIGRLLLTLRDEGRTVILANHDIAQSLDMAGRVIALRRGRIVLDEPASDLTPAGVLREVSAT
jgi:heme exporter protein A